MRLTRFGSLTLPIVNNDALVQPGAIRTGIIETAGGGYDSLGDERAPLSPTQLPYRCRILAASESAAWTAFKAIRALKGQVRDLYRREPDGSTQWVRARLVNAIPTQVARFPQALDVDLLFDLVSPIWNGTYHGPAWLIGEAGILIGDGHRIGEPSDNKILLTTALTGISITNNGDYPVTDVKITVHAVGSDITAFEIYSAVTLIDLVFVGSGGALHENDDLVIDCGLYTVAEASVDHYDDLTLGSDHIIDTWFRLDPGVNLFNVARTGGNASSYIVFYFRDGSL